VSALVVQLVPLALGIILSPLAIMALVAVLLSSRARLNGIAYLVGWVLGLVLVLAVSMWILQLLDVHEMREPPVWASLVRLLLALVLVASAVWVYRKGAARIRLMAAASSPAEIAAAAPTLPGWLQAVATFRPFRCFALGFGIFVLNPVDASCAIIAALDISAADIDSGAMIGAAVVFAFFGILPIAVPVVLVIIRGSGADATLARIRGWIAGNTHILNAGLLLVVGVLQLDKAIAALL
jgi:hypothetical protein